MIKSTRKKRDTIYLAKVGVLSALAFVLYRFARFPIFPSYAFLDLDFSAVPSLIGGFALGPTAVVLTELIKGGLKIATEGSNTAYVGDLSNFIVSLSFVLPAAIIYKYNKSMKGALVGTVVGGFTTLVIASISNYFITVPLYSKFAPYMMEGNFRVTFAFSIGTAFNAIKVAVNAIVTFLLYKRLSPILHISVLPENRLFRSYNLSSADETVALGEKLGKSLKGGETVFLQGDLGAGKTTFTKGIAKGLGITDNILSPTFILMKTYEGRLTLNHIDMYRLDEGAEVEALGFEDVLYRKDSVTVIEWNRLDKIKGKLILVVFETTGDETRKITIQKKNVK